MALMYYGFLGRITQVLLPKDSDENSVSAKLKNGVLNVSIQKKKECKAKEIKVE